MFVVNLNDVKIQWREQSLQENRKSRPYGGSKVEDQKIEDQWVSARAFIARVYNQGFLSAQGPYCGGEKFCKETNITATLLDHDEATPTELPKIWNAVCDVIKTTSNKELPENVGQVEISASFIDHVFRPLIPDSPMLNWAHKKKESPLKRYVGLFGLVFETPIRLLMVLGGHALLSGYNLLSRNKKAADYTAYYRFRLGINAYSPAQVLAGKIGSLTDYKLQHKEIGKKIDLEAMLKKAEEQFAEHYLKEEILKSIEKHLKNHQENGCVELIDKLHVREESEDIFNALQAFFKANGITVIFLE